ncbi:MAG TPA: hypothetical protein VF600_14405 [Abditibacteriaceae bacterium]
MSSTRLSTAGQQGATPDRLQLLSFLAPPPAAGDLRRWPAARSHLSTQVRIGSA